MPGRASWLLSIAFACAPCGGMPAALAQTPPRAGGEQNADYVVEIPAEEAESDQLPTDDSPGDEEMSAAETQPGRQAFEFTGTDHDRDTGEVEVIKERFPNGSIKIERSVTQDAHGNYINHGPWKTWDQSGRLVAQGDFDHGQRTGTWVRWYRTAIEAELLNTPPYEQFINPFISQAAFKAGRLHGAWTIYDSKMHKISQWHFVDGRRHGTSTWWHATGKKMREVTYRDGEIEGQLLVWNPDGALKTKETYQDGRKLAEKVTHHNGGQKKSAGTYLFAKEVEQTPDDWWNCKPAVNTKSGRDEKHGPATAWYANGQRQVEGAYEQDVPLGRFIWWHENGQKALEGSFDDGKQDGPWSWWYPSGQKSIEGYYVSGAPTGRWTWWKEDGKVAQSADLSSSNSIVIAPPQTLDPGAVPHIGAPPRQRPIKR